MNYYNLITLCDFTSHTDKPAAQAAEADPSKCISKNHHFRKTVIPFEKIYNFDAFWDLKFPILVQNSLFNKPCVATFVIHFSVQSLISDH